jgi:hypothetical protein
VRYTEEIVQDEGEWSIWEVDGEKDVVSLTSHVDDFSSRRNQASTESMAPRRSPWLTEMGVETALLPKSVVICEAVSG